ncbi:MAG: hypothetical protein UY44_C0003G0021 [Candidatus Kaiserbacteria bacterium GW2011_GWA2_49_19]|uniref:Capsule synthesis protein CapA domain-containing protein n=1 Tax=Candidatus Kaiserbacteria bacterium GW2011_GWA2_49_19 TaxID=1618669 RepID=A0A0G1VS56_9BACT|nr:MAG: hypothetical protein UY44_C0003G0021 [Candidatus Kaiserbacteria bacterium GW2011_GWA2_49_19]
MKSNFFIGGIFLALVGAFLLYFNWAVSAPRRGEAVAAKPAAAPYHRATSLDRDRFEEFFSAAAPGAAVGEPVASAVVPHHLAAAAPLAVFFEMMKGQKPPVVVLLGPNHKQAGRDSIVTSEYEWKTPYGNISPASAVIQKLVVQKVVAVNETVIDPEWSVGALVPFIKRTWPSATLVPLIVKDRTPAAILEQLAQTLAGTLPPGSLVLVSVDFSHYLPYFVADFHDILSENILATGDSTRLNKAEIDSIPSLYFLFSYNRLRGAQKWHEVSRTNSAALANHPEWGKTTSHLVSYYTAGDPAPDTVITIQFFGDIMLDRNVAKAMGARGFDYLLEKIRGQENRFFSGVDFFMANLEGAFAPSRVQTSKEIAFQFDPTLARELKKFGFDAATIANNHVYDMGRKNVAFTKQTLAEAGVSYCGDQLAEGAEYNLVAGRELGLLEPVAFVCLETVTHVINKNNLAAAIADARQKARYVIVQAHGGAEYRRASTKAQQELYHWLIDQGATAVIGHHPHVVEEIEIYHGKPIFYSLGNFIFDQYFSKDTQEGLSVGLVLKDGAVSGARLFPFFGVRSQVQLMTGERRDEFMKWMSENSRLDGRTIEDGKIAL